MENASKALLMTGSILIGIILLSLGVYIYNIMSEAKKAESMILSEEQLVKYNSEFLAYDKSRMYGTDVISVLNKARDNNERYKDDESMFINISFSLLDDVKRVTMKYTWNGKNFDVTTERTKNKDKYEFDGKNESGNGKECIYTLEDDFEIIKNFLATSTEPTAIRDESHIKKISNPEKNEYYTITYTGFSDFKRMIFKCNSSKTQYNGLGKISYMEFEQVKSSTY